MYKSILLFLALSFSAGSFGQSKVQSRYFLLYFKTWNFLKYYHPDLASGKLDADSLFFKHLQPVCYAVGKKEFNASINDLFADLSTTFPGNRTLTAEKDVLRKNQDFSWYEKGTEFDPKNKKRFKQIFGNRYSGDQHYYLPGKNYIALIPNEREYAFPKEEPVPSDYQFLALAKMLGAVDYLYPHKYRMTRDFDELISGCVFPVLEKQSVEDYERMLLELSASLEDSHTFSFFEQVKNKKAIFGNAYYPPFTYRVFDDGILVTDIIVPELCEAHDIKTGDYIVMINEKVVSEKISDLSRLLSVSNLPTLIFHLSDYRTNLIWNLEHPNVNLDILRGGEEQKKTIPFIGSGDPNLKLLNEYFGALPSGRVENESLIILENDIAYFRIDNVFRLIENVPDEKIDHQMDSILDLARKQKGIIFDMRGYPDWGGFVPTYLVKHFGKDLVPYGKYYEVNKREIGTYVLRTDQETYYNPGLIPSGNVYKGKVVILVNPATQSMSEWNTMCLQHVFPNAVTIGEQSAGADGDLKTMNLPGGYQLDFTGNAIFYPDGTEAQKNGVKIDQLIKLAKENYSKDKDFMLKKAVEWIRAQ